MRGDVERQTMILSAGTPDQLIPQDHPIRLIKPMVDRALAELSPTFSRMYAKVGRPSIPPEHLLKGCLLMALYTIRSERQFCERLQYDLLFKWVPEWTLMFTAELLLGSPLLMRLRSASSKGGEVTQRTVSPESFREIS